MAPHHDGRDSSLLRPRSVQQEQHGLWTQWCGVSCTSASYQLCDLQQNANSWSLRFLRWEQQTAHTGCVWEHYPKEHVRQISHNGDQHGQLASPSALYGVIMLNPHSKEQGRYATSTYEWINLTSKRSLRLPNVIGESCDLNPGSRTPNPMLILLLVVLLEIRKQSCYLHGHPYLNALFE